MKIWCARAPLDMLTDLGYAVVEAPSAEEALRLIRNDVVSQPSCNRSSYAGHEWYGPRPNVRSERPSLQILLVSGYADAEDMRRTCPAYQAISK